MIRRHTASAPAAKAECGMLGCWVAYQGQMVSSVKAIVLSYIVTMWQVSWGIRGGLWCRGYPDSLSAAVSSDEDQNLSL